MGIQDYQTYLKMAALQKSLKTHGGSLDPVLLVNVQPDQPNVIDDSSSDEEGI